MIRLTEDDIRALPPSAWTVNGEPAGDVDRAKAALISLMRAGLKLRTTAIEFEDDLGDRYRVEL